MLLMKSSEPLKNLGACLKKLGAFEKARSLFEKARRLGKSSEPWKKLEPLDKRLEPLENKLRDLKKNRDFVKQLEPLENKLGTLRMNRVRIVISYNGRWEQLPDGSQRFVGSDNQGMYVSKNMSYEELVSIVHTVVKYDVNKYNIDLQSISIVPGATCRTFVRNEDDVQFMLGEDRAIPQVCVSLIERETGDVIQNDIPAPENTQPFGSASGSNQVFTQRSATEGGGKICVVQPVVVVDHADIGEPQFDDVFGCRFEMNDGRYNEQYNEMYNEENTEPNLGPNQDVVMRQILIRDRPRVSANLFQVPTVNLLNGFTKALLLVGSLVTSSASAYVEVIKQGRINVTLSDRQHPLISIQMYRATSM
ncbi:hypothetical protein Dsin_005200 [Dipteronia sinensis]|uniref:Uncharacterized protein n=1 Tax=Dipteronia sinensis TaxID=43782 RepID=A0AAE0EEE1_9ROSI|nr:hypothetical protein Dsin_005200 [Dipteronia sinensis]